MKQKLLTLFVLLVSAMTAFADASGSGVTAGNDINKNGISYEYQFTEQDGNVTFTVTPNTDGIIGYVGTYIDDESHLQGDYETKGTTRTWKGLAKGTTIKVKGWFDAAGRMYFDEVTYTTGTEAAPDTEKPIMVKAEATSIRDTKATLTLNATDNRNGMLTYKVTIGENSYTTTGSAGKDATIDITGLTAETKYDFSVTATDEAGNVSDAKTGTFTTATGLGFSVTTTGNIAKVVGPVTAANVEQINSADVMNIDLTGVTSIEDGVTIQPKHKNAIIIATGSVTEGVYSADSKFDPIKDMANVVVLVNGYYHPLKQLEFVDIPGEPLWTGIRELNDFISTGSTGWKVTRTIKAGAHASVCVIMAIVNIPEGLSAWEAVDYDETVGLKFNKANVIGGNFPYIVRNTADHDIDLSFTGAGDINFKSYVNNEAYKKQVGSTNIWFCGNWKEALETDGTQWIVKNDGKLASVVKAHGTNISPFRAYFTGIPEGAPAKLSFIDGEATGINGVNAEAAADGAIYNLAGQKVSAAYKGIVIKNGKKYLMK